MEYELGAPGRAYTQWAANMALEQGMVSTATISLPTRLINQRCGPKLGLDGSLNLEVRCQTDLLKIWHLLLQDLYRKAVLLSIITCIMRYKFWQHCWWSIYATSYDYDAPLDEYGLLRPPKWGHLKDLHRAIKLCEPALVSSDPTVTTPGNGTCF